MITQIIKSKSFKNAAWLIGGKVIQMLLSLLVGIYTARYLGPGNYGLVNYGMAYVGFFMSLCTLGINSVIIKDFFDHPQEQGTAIGTTLVLRALSGFCSVIMITGIVAVLEHDEPVTIVIVVLCSLSLLFQIFDTFNYWFQSQYKSKITAIATLIAYVVTSLYRIVLLVTSADIVYFALAYVVDYVIIGVVLITVYRGLSLYNGVKRS